MSDDQTTPQQVVESFLNNTTDPESLRDLVEVDAVYISLNFSNLPLKKIMPWAGTSQGSEAFVATFDLVSKYWEILNFEVTDIFGSGEQVAVFGTFTYKSVVLKKTVTSPFSIHAKVRNGKIFYFQFMEDTLATAGTFKMAGEVEFHSNPNGDSVVLTEFS